MFTLVDHAKVWSLRVPVLFLGQDIIIQASIWRFTFTFLDMQTLQFPCYFFRVLDKLEEFLLIYLAEYVGA